MAFNLGEVEIIMFTFKFTTFCFNDLFSNGWYWLLWYKSRCYLNKSHLCLHLSVIEELYEKGEFQWDLYVKRLLDLPTSKNIPSIEGICIDGGKCWQTWYFSYTANFVTHANKWFAVLFTARSLVKLKH